MKLLFNMGFAFEDALFRNLGEKKADMNTIAYEIWKKIYFGNLEFAEYHAFNAIPSTNPYKRLT